MALDFLPKIAINEYMRKDHYVGLGTALKSARIKKGLTQAEVARLLGYLNAQFISNAERGLCRLPFEAISRLVRLYDMDPEIVIGNFLRAHEAYYRQVFNTNLKGVKSPRAAKARRARG